MFLLPLPSERTSLNAHLRSAGAPDALRHLILDISRAAKYISYAIKTTETGLSGGTNQSGEKQLQLDVLSDTIVSHYLAESGLVASYASEEAEELIIFSDNAPYTVVFDPLDGSSLVEANFAIGSIFGIYEGLDCLGKTPREQVAALYVIYGPRTLLVYSCGKGVHSFILNDVGEFILYQEYHGIADTAKNYSPGNLRALADNPAYDSVLHDWLKRELTLRYSGCMVADIHHIIAKGQGIFTNVGGSKYPQGKLRLVFECGPFAYLVEQAGGASSNGNVSILDVPIENIHQRTPVIIGSAHEVAAVTKALR
ncbi:fructose-bisphosphatase class I [Candidatus Peregrinibacteria bacterium CG10_big_fil_rev_8_21_14_0_10_55_24]|nr:MAG: fructose-bisphosphatase class I [Candidatus Peregrinibacteria bacterium CG10_big_fil_rev_8_21_14_0_10_55_24]